MPVVGPGASAAISEAAASICAGSRDWLRVMMVVGGSFDRRLWASQILATTRDLNAELYVHKGQTTPTSVVALWTALRRHRTDVVIAIGGGTVIDAAKAAAALSGLRRLDERTVVAACHGTLGVDGLDLEDPTTVALAVPTTPGTGAEVTPFATIWDTGNGRKLSLTGEVVRPRCCVLDPDLLAGLDRTVLAHAALDTMCQGAEAAWSVHSTETSIAHGLAAVGLAGGVLDRIAQLRLRTVDKLAMLLAGHHSGQAITLAQTSSCHAISYPLTLRLGLAHGHACGVSLPRLMRYNAAVTAANCVDPRGPDHVGRVIDRIREALGESTVARAAARIEDFLGACGLAHFDDLPVAADDIATEALSYPRCSDNPRQLTVATLSRLLGTPVESEEPCF